MTKAVQEETSVTYKTIDEAYVKEMPRLLSLARSTLFAKDQALDCVHKAFEKALEYLKDHPKRKISGFLLMRELNRIVAKANNRLTAESVFMDYDFTDKQEFENQDDGSSAC